MKKTLADPSVALFWEGAASLALFSGGSGVRLRFPFAWNLYFLKAKKKPVCAFVRGTSVISTSESSSELLLSLDEDKSLESLAVLDFWTGRQRQAVIF